MFRIKKEPEKSTIKDSSGGHPFRTLGIPTSQKEEEPQDMPKTLFHAQCKNKKKNYVYDYFDILANKYEEVLSFLIDELKYKAENILEIKRRGSIVEGTSVIAYKH